jgi:hypothetical protein
MSQSTLIRVTPKLIINWFTITFVEVVEAQDAQGASTSVVRVGTAEGFRDIPMAAGGARLLDHLQSIADDLVATPPEAEEIPTQESHARSFADRFVRPTS